MSVDILLGLQWGDEGKGKIVDYLAEDYDIIARFQGGPNAGHTLKIDGNKFVLHTVPSGIFRKHQVNIIGNGVVIDPITLKREIEGLREFGIPVEKRLLIAHKAHLILPTHRLLDAASERSKGKEKIGSTLKGIGPTYMDKTGRNGLRIGEIFEPDFQEKYRKLKEKHLHLYKLYPEIDFDLEQEENKWFEALESLKAVPQISCEYYLNEAIAAGKKVLAEGAQGSMLDINYGTYPYVTSSSTVSAGVCIGLGIAPKYTGEVIGITKAYCTRVGSGPFPTELFDENGELLQKEGNEFGATTGRPRRCGWIDLIQLRYTCMINGVSQLVLTKLDVLDVFEQIQACVAYGIDGKSVGELPMLLDKEIITENTHFNGWKTATNSLTSYDDLPSEAKNYIDFLEGFLNIPIKLISVGPEREKILVKA